MNFTRTKLLKENKSNILENVKQGKMYVDQGKLSADFLQTLIEIDPTPTRKFVGWMAKQWVLGNVDDIDVLRNTVEEFNTFAERGRIQIKDINQFKTFQDLADEVDSINQTGGGLSNKDLESDYEVIMDTPDLLIMTPHTHEASRKLGLTHFAYRDCGEGRKDSAWCTTYKAPDHFNSYYLKHGVTFYYIKIKSEALMAKLQKAFGGEENIDSFRVVALAVLQDGKIDGYDGSDARMTEQDIELYTNTLGIS